MRLAFVCSSLFLFAACSGDDSFTDAAVGDDTPDIDANAGIDATPSGTVHVTTFARNEHAADERFPNAEVLVIGLDGTLRDRDQTDSDGEATLDVVSGDTVTAIYDLVADNDVYLTTIAGVKPGDDLSFGDRPYLAPTATSSMTITWPALTGTPTWVYLVDNCANYYYPTPTATSQVITHGNNCDSATVSAMLYSQSGTYPYPLLQWGVVEDVPFVDAGTTAITVLSAPSTFSVNLTGVSPEIDDEYYVYPSVVVGDAWVGTGDSSIYLTPDQGAASGSTASWTGGGDATVISESLYRLGNFGNQGAYYRLPAGTSTLTTPTVPLPWLSDQVIAVVPSRLIQWFQLGSGVYDAAQIEFSWSIDTGGGGGGGKAAASGAHLGSGSSTSFEWSIFVPPGVTMLAFPELPADLAAYAPPSSESIYPQVKLMEADTVASYDAFRALPEWDMGCLDCTPLSATTWPHVRYSYTGGGSDKPSSPKHPHSKHQPPRAPRGASTRR